MTATRATPSHLSDWTPQRKVTLLQLRRRSAAVGLWRLVFVAGAAISAGLFIGPITASAFLFSGSSVVTIPGDEVVTMLNPRFTGRNVDGEAFLITADTARRRRADPNIIDLVNPRMVDENGTAADAPTGVFDQNAGFLDLFEAVNVRDGEGYAFETTAARVHISEGRVEGLQPLSGTGPLGDVSADTYEVLDEGDRIILRGNVDMVIFPDGRIQPGSDTE